jgi:hypothetical protein
MQCFIRCALALAGMGLCVAQQSTSAPNAIVFAGGGYQIPANFLAVAPGQVIVLHVHGVTANISSPVLANPGPTGLPYTLAGLSVNLVQGQAGTATPIGLIAAYQTHCLGPCSPVTGITLQVPFSLETNAGANGDPPPQLQISQNGTVLGAVGLNPVSDSVHVINTCDDTQVAVPAADSVPADICAPAVLVGGSLNSLYNLAHGGEELAVWLYGMGAISAPGTGCCISPSQLPQPLASFQLNFDFRPNAPAFPVVPGFGLTSAPVFVAYVGGGQYQVNFLVPPVPAGLPACDGVAIKSNLTVTITGPNSSDAAQICVAPSSASSPAGLL